MTRTLADPSSGPTSRPTSNRALAVTLAAALAVTTFTAAPARADGNGDAIAAAAFFGLIAVGIIAATRDSRARPYTPPVEVRPRHLPAQCRFEIRHGADRGMYYESRCLARNNVALWSLPDRCERWVDLPRSHNEVVAYSAQCLSRAGGWARDWAGDRAGD